MNIKFHTILIGLIAIIAAAIFFVTLVRATIFAPELQVKVPETARGTEEAAPGQEPSRLSIPKLDIDTDVQHVGVNAKGNMGVPSNYSDVAWYKYGPVPGQRGSAVIDGHVDNGLGLSGVFKRLPELRRGDDVYIETEDGSRLHFVVTSIETYPYKSVPTELIFNRADGAYLNLITCDGNWIKAEKTYDERLVVFTRLVND